MAAFFSTIMEGLKAMGLAVLRLLPPSPFVKYQQFLESPDLEWLKWLNWIVPIGNFIAIMEIWLACVATYYLCSVVLRWWRAIE